MGNDSRRAVFLSYASEDAQAARQICEGLRAAGIEVWFDQSELRAGDAWDQKIRQQIRDCTLFLPIISENTQSRPEGYFRLEWRLADQRTHSMGRSRAFLVPICVDATLEMAADVPDSFSVVQWTRLPEGIPTAEFVIRVKQLLNEQTPAPVNALRPYLPRVVGNTSGGSRWWIGVVIAVFIAAAGVAYYLSIASRREIHSTSRATALEPRAIASPIIVDNSIAVLPFADMSERHDQEYFSDGLAEELIDRLGRTPGLKVIARTSSFSFKGKSDDIPTIARKLGVANVLEGSVRKSGKHLRVTAQLVRADTGYHLWSETYDREFRDIFTIQDDIAAAVVKALKVSLVAESASTLSGTSNVEAYNLYLQGRAIGRSAITLADAERSVGYFERAVKADPTFAPAWSGLSMAQFTRLRFAPGDQRAGIADEGLHAVEQALRLDQNFSEAHSALALGLFDRGDFVGAESQVRKALEIDPGNAQALSQAGVLALARGQFAPATAYFQKAIDNDPVNPQRYQYLAFALYTQGKYAQALSMVQEMEDLNPGIAAHDTLKSEILLAQGDAAAALVANDRIGDENSRSNRSRVAILDALGRTAEGDSVLERMEKVGDDNAYEIACVYARRGNMNQAFKWLERIPPDRSIELLNILVDPDLKGIRGDPRFKVLLDKVNMPQ